MSEYTGKKPSNQPLSNIKELLTPKPAGCIHDPAQPEGCYRVRCQLGKRCAEAVADGVPGDRMMGTAGLQEAGPTPLDAVPGYSVLLPADGAGVALPATTPPMQGLSPWLRSVASKMDEGEDRQTIMQWSQEVDTARGIPSGVRACTTEQECDGMPWCRINGKCQRTAGVKVDAAGQEKNDVR